MEEFKIHYSGDTDTARHHRYSKVRQKRAVTDDAGGVSPTR